MVAIFLNIFIFLFGLIVGSFLNCLIYRLEQDQGKTILKGKSFCPKCHHSLRWFDLFPVISFFFLKGKCRYCSKKISWQYPTVEIATGLLFLLIFNFQFSMINEFSIFNQFLVLFFWFIIWSLLLVIFVYDLKHYIIPDKVLVPFLGFILFFRILPFFGNWKLEIGNSRPLLNGLFLACFVSFIFFLIWLASKGRAMGLGDVKLIFPLILMLGWPLGLVGLMIAFFSGSLIGLILIGLKRKGLKSQVPFGPFLIGGCFFAFLWGEIIWQWYVKLIFNYQ